MGMEGVERGRALLQSCKMEDLPVGEKAGLWECCGVVVPRAVRSHGTFDMAVVEGREDVGRSRYATL